MELRIEKAGSPIWAMEQEENGETFIGLRFDCGDSGFVKLTREQVQDVIDALKPWDTRQKREAMKQATTEARVAILDAQEVKLPKLDITAEDRRFGDDHQYYARVCRERQLLDALRALQAWRKMAGTQNDTLKYVASGAKESTAAIAAYDALAGKGE